MNGGGNFSLMVVGAQMNGVYVPPSNEVNVDGYEKGSNNPTVTTLRAETFAGRNFRDFCDFGTFSRKLMPGKKLNEKFAKVIFAKNQFFQKPRKFFKV